MSLTQLLELEMEVMQMLSFNLIQVSPFDCLQLITDTWKSLSLEDEATQDESQMHLECSEVIDETNKDYKLFELLDLIMMDFKSSTIKPHLLTLGLFFMSKIFIQDNLSISRNDSDFILNLRVIFDTL